MHSITMIRHNLSQTFRYSINPVSMTNVKYDGNKIVYIICVVMVVKNPDLHALNYLIAVAYK